MGFAMEYKSEWIAFGSLNPGISSRRKAATLLNEPHRHRGMSEEGSTYGRYKYVGTDGKTYFTHEKDHWEFCDPPAYLVDTEGDKVLKADAVPTISGWVPQLVKANVTDPLERIVWQGEAMYEWEEDGSLVTRDQALEVAEEHLSFTLSEALYATPSGVEVVGGS